MNKTLKTLAVLSLALALALVNSGCSACSRNLDTSSSSMGSSNPSSSMPADEPYNSGNADSSGPSFDDDDRSSSSSSSAAESLPTLAMSADFLQISTLSAEPVKWGPGHERDEQGRSTACIGLQSQYGDAHNAWFIAPAEGNTVTLTFDQGYENGYTAQILDTLKEKQVQAVFFLTGDYLRSAPELVQRMVDEGHILGNHTDRHKHYCDELSIEESLADAKWMQDEVRKQFDYEMRLFRFPEGIFSEQSLSLVEQMGYQSMFWSFAYNDWNRQNQMSPDAAMERVLGYLHPGEIMLLHSVGKTNAEILPQLIDAIRDKGYTIGPFEGMVR